MTTDQFKALQSKVKQRASKVDLLIGLDPGTSTGFAAFNTHLGVLTTVESMNIIEAMERVRSLFDQYTGSNLTLHVYVEDTRKLRLPKALQSSGRDRGAGSVARDMSILETFLKHYGIPHTMAGLCPKEFRIGNAEWFKKKTGYEGRCNEHGRCAAGMIWGR